MKLLADLLQRRLGRQISRDQSLHRRLAKALPAKLADTVLFARVDGAVLYLTVESPGAATRLRFCQRDLLRACPAGMQPKSIKFKVSPHTKSSATQTRHREAPYISAAASTHIESVADGVGSTTLRHALKQLANRSKNG